MDLLTASSRAHGWQGASGAARLIPALYNYLGGRLLRRLSKNNSQGSNARASRVSLLEYDREGWQFHAKGLWYVLMIWRITAIAATQTRSTLECLCRRSMECLCIATECTDLILWIQEGMVFWIIFLQIRISESLRFCLAIHPVILVLMSHNIICAVSLLFLMCVWGVLLYSEELPGVRA